MKKRILFSFVIATGCLFAQDDSHSRIKSELVEWDAVRGEWLAESFNAMANNQPIPDRTFPEDLTPAEMYSLVPADRQGRIREIASQLGRTNQPNNTTPNRVPPTGQTGTNRVPVGGSGTNNRPTNPNDQYNYFVTRPTCPLTMGRSYGDPHIRTFDGKSYSFQTVGEYVLSSSPDRTFEVQARQKPESNNVSLNTAVAMNVYGDRVGIYASDTPDGQNGTPLRVNGRPVFLNNETYYLPHGGTVQNTGREYVVTWPTGEKVQAKLSRSSGMNFMNISVFVYQCNGNYFGLMGNANGRSDDDFSGGNDNRLASSTIFDPFGSRDFGRNTTAMEREHLAFLARDFGNQFLVNDQTSLFDYGFGQSSWSFYDPSFPRTHITLGDISQADRDRARRECERQGILADDMSGCVMDLAYSNIQPTPRPTTPSRTNGRELPPVSERKPNVNRPDVFERERIPSQGDTRTPIGGKKGNSETHVIGGQESQLNERETVPVRESATPINQTNKPSETTRPTTVKPTTNVGERKPVGNTSTGATKQPSSETSKPVSRPAEKPVAKPTANPSRTGSDASKPSSSGSTSKPQTSSGKTTSSSGSVKPSTNVRTNTSSGSSSKPQSGSSSGTRSGGVSSPTPSKSGR